MQKPIQSAYIIHSELVILTAVIAGSSGSKRASPTAAIQKPTAVLLLGTHLIRRFHGSNDKHTPESGAGRKRTVYECATCNVELHADCFEAYHTTP